MAGWARILFLVACAGVLPACERLLSSSAQPGVRTLLSDGFCEDMKPLNQVEIQKLKQPDGFLDLLPHAAKTPVAILAAPDSPELPIGFAFAVHASAARFTLHATRRQLERLAQTKGVPVPLVLLVPGHREQTDQACVTVIDGGVGPEVLIHLGGLEQHESRREPIVQMLEHWGTRAALRVSRLSAGAVDIEIGTVSADYLDELAQDIVPLLHDRQADTESVREMISHNREVTLPL